VDDDARLLAAYDDQLRTDAEARGAVAEVPHGPLRLITFPGGRGFVTYRDLGDADQHEVRRLVGTALGHFRDDTDVGQAEWKTRAHDRAPGLHESLLEHGFVPEEPESIMVGDLRALVVDVPLPDGVRLRQVTVEADIRAMGAMQAEVFGDPDAGPRTEHTLEQLARGDLLELWVAETDGEFVSAGRVEVVPGTAFAGIWGGATRPEWRGRGIYRALTAARAQAALRMGATMVNSDSTEFSRPILERAGLRRVSTTTPYLWRRAA